MSSVVNKEESSQPVGVSKREHVWSRSHLEPMSLTR